MTEDNIPGLPAPDLKIKLERIPDPFDPLGLLKANNVNANNVSEAFVQHCINVSDLELKFIGYEYETDAGRIDILCEDKDGVHVVIEVKRGTAGDDAVGQILGYMDAIGKDSKGIIIAKDFTHRVRHAVALNVVFENT